jgi:hypothetical protein
MLMNDLFHQIGMSLKQASDCPEHLLDSFPVAMCDNIRIFNVKLIKLEEYRGYIASKKRYFYGVRSHHFQHKTAEAKPAGESPLLLLDATS